MKSNSHPQLHGLNSLKLLIMASSNIRFRNERNQNLIHFVYNKQPILEISISNLSLHEELRDSTLQNPKSGHMYAYTQQHISHKKKTNLGTKILIMHNKSQQCEILQYKPKIGTYVCLCTTTYPNKKKKKKPSYSKKMRNK